MGFRVVITPKAKQHIADALLWYTDINPQLAADFADQLEDAIQIALTQPLLFQKVSRNYRKINLVRFPYKVIYFIEDENIIIAAVIHHKRNNKHWISRK